MLTLRSLALLSAASGLALALDIGTLDPCAHNCLLTAPTYDCPASQYACLCPNVDWGIAIRNCVRDSGACAADYEPALMGALRAGCSAVGAPFPAGDIPADPPAETPAPEPTPAEPTTDAPAAAEPTPTETPTENPGEEATSTAVETSPTAESTAEGTSTPTESPSKSSSGDEAEETNEAPEDEGAPAGLPEAAKIGIGVGVGAAVLALIGVGACIFLRNRHVDKTSDDSSGADRYKISPPMPSREQNPYNHGNNSSDYDIGANELEIKSYRYDDMTEGKQPKPMEPRQMV
ncbi:hypothetical protein QBC41DRAFT_235840 [Cercophora samala]|uniref:CFEM domain-containing protein n=1 Tax=Cercophora samala TaxID=330535 RepID=A0AA39YZT8_9PEZI|nr:hypothetical protein QBC41DRAFT_235840 [Cercophora samala]